MENGTITKSKTSSFTNLRRLKALKFSLRFRLVLLQLLPELSVLFGGVLGDVHFVHQVETSVHPGGNVVVENKILTNNVTFWILINIELFWK